MILFKFCADFDRWTGKFVRYVNKNSFDAIVGIEQYSTKNASYPESLMGSSFDQKDIIQKLPDNIDHYYDELVRLIQLYIDAGFYFSIIKNYYTITGDQPSVSFEFYNASDFLIFLREFYLENYSFFLKNHLSKSMHGYTHYINISYYMDDLINN